MSIDRLPFTELLASIPQSPEELARQLGVHKTTIYRWKSGETEPHGAARKLVSRFAEEHFAKKRVQGRFSFIDLFAGIGGMRIGAEAVGGACVYTSEWNKFARETYKQNFVLPPEHRFDGDISLVDPHTIPDHDLLLAGFPCQPFSIAGVSKKNALGKPHGFRCQEQGNLFFEVAEIINAKRPAAFLLENVKNLQSHDGGKTFRIILQTLRDELGYEVHYRVINAKGFVPQNRERIFIVGFRKQTTFSFDALQVPDPAAGPRMNSILHPENGSEQAEGEYTVGPVAHVSDRYILTPHLWDYLRNYAAKHRALGHGFGFGLVGPNDVARTLSARYYKDGSEILISRGPRSRPRRLTPRECARLMGFDRDDRTYVIKCSDTQAYKQFGNAVVPPVVEVVTRHLQPHLLEIVHGKQLQLALPA